MSAVTSITLDLEAYIIEKIEDELQYITADFVHQAEKQLWEKERALRKKYAEELAKPIIEEMHKFMESRHAKA